jgi:hypothetical protein
MTFDPSKTIILQMVEVRASQTVVTLKRSSRQQLNTRDTK